MVVVVVVVEKTEQLSSHDNLVSRAFWLFSKWRLLHRRPRRINRRISRHFEKHPEGPGNEIVGMTYYS